MTIKRVHQGDPVEISANAFNAWSDAADDLRKRQLATTASQQPERRDVDIILVRNDSDSDVDQFGILGIDGPLITPADNLDEFKRRVVISGVTPAVAHIDSFVVLLEPLAANMVGEAIISGVCQVQVDVVNAADTVCGADVDDIAKLKSGTGCCRIIWKESGTGTKWAIVRVGDGGGLKIATLDASLSYNGTCSATITKGGFGTVTAHDVLLQSGESLDSGTKVILALIDGDECVIDASCSV